MYFISQDLNWFTIKRHEYLCKRLVMNYSIYVSGLTDDMKCNGLLKDYFNNCFSSSYFAHHHHGSGANINNVNGGGEDEVTNVVASANVALNIPNLQKEVDKRTALISKLEHAINVEQVKGTKPTHKANGIRGSVIGAQTVDSVPAYTEELQELNDDIGNRIDNIMNRVKARDMEGGEGGGEVIAEGDVEAGGDVGTARGGGDVMTTTTDVQTAVHALPPEEEEDRSADTPKYKRAASRLSDTVKVGTSVVKSIIFNDKEDGDARNAAFVSFNNLTSANLARQAVHNQRAWSVVAQKAPLPELVNWKNVGKSNVSKQGAYTVVLPYASVLISGFCKGIPYFLSIRCVRNSCLTHLFPSFYQSYLYSRRVPQFDILCHPVYLLDSPRGIRIIIIQCGQVDRNIHILG